MKKFVQRQGLYCRAVKLDINSLSKLRDCEAILHLPEKNHFIVLGEIDDRYVGSIDLSSNRFYYRTDINFFDMNWTDGIALLISDQPIQIQGSVKEISNTQLRNITGGNGWQCIDLLQEYDYESCDPYGCDNYYEYYPERGGCEYVGSGYCAHSSYTRKVESRCKKNSYGNCGVTGEWRYYYMWACD